MQIWWAGSSHADLDLHFFQTYLEVCSVERVNIHVYQCGTYTRKYNCLSTDCPWLDSCKAPNSTWKQKCMTYRCDVTSDAGHYQWNIQPVQYGKIPSDKTWIQNTNRYMLDLERYEFRIHNVFLNNILSAFIQLCWQTVVTYPCRLLYTELIRMYHYFSRLLCLKSHTIQILILHNVLL